MEVINHRAARVAEHSGKIMTFASGTFNNNVQDLRVAVWTGAFPSNPFYDTVKVELMLAGCQSNVCIRIQTYRAIIMRYFVVGVNPS